MQIALFIISHIIVGGNVVILIPHVKPISGINIKTDPTVGWIIMINIKLSDTFENVYLKIKSFLNQIRQIRRFVML